MGRPKGRSQLLIRRRKEKIMISAYIMVVEKGYASITIKDIAQRANLSRGLLFYYFSSKEDIFIQTLEWVNSRITRRLEKKLSNIMDPAEKLRIKIDDSFLSVKENRMFYLFYLDFLREGARNEKFLKPNNEFNFSAQSKIIRILKEGIEAQIFSPNLEIEQVSKVVKSIVDGLLIQWLFDKPEKFHNYKQLAKKSIFQLVLNKGEDYNKYLI